MELLTQNRKMMRLEENMAIVRTSCAIEGGSQI